MRVLDILGGQNIIVYYTTTVPGYRKVVGAER